eukprot:TRINITY_DN8822_c0_g2_i1.p1 TRINITY_DN8822_c0_g2~~TRINITY_DN8822_c0_g2_i1.p1  ORF type:complete len:935 (-),score=242.27 TRINITY_DN8822_c0_g2_i1:193-2901(-)
MLMTGAVPLATAQAAVLAECAALSSERSQGLRDAVGRVLAEPVVAVRDLPQLPTSIVDGFAVCSEDFGDKPTAKFAAKRRRADGAAGAEGASNATALQQFEAAYVTTGGLLPPRADAVRPEEEANRVGDDVVLTRCEAGKWVRLPGSDMKAGDVILQRGHRLSPMDLSAIAAAGIPGPIVVRRPRVAVLSSGKELIDPEQVQLGQSLAPEKIFDANRHMLLEMAREEGAETIDLGIVGDTRDAILDCIRRAAAEADVVVCSGGVSEGDFDFVRPVLRELATLLFERVVVKPGKPASCAVLNPNSAGFGKGGRVLLFGLPGNPASAAVTFRLLVAPALQKLSGRGDLGQPSLRVKLEEMIQADPQRPEYIRASLRWDPSGELVALHTGLQRSSRAASLAGAGALLQLAAGQRIQAGEQVQALLMAPLPANSYDSSSPAAPMSGQANGAEIAGLNKQKVEAQVYQSLVKHLQNNPQVQNIDLMNLSGFCRNCLAKWYMKGAEENGVSNMDYEAARKVVYGMTYDEWKTKHQTPATQAQKDAFENAGNAQPAAAASKGQPGDGTQAPDQASASPSGNVSVTPAPVAEADSQKAAAPDAAQVERIEAFVFQKVVQHLRQNPEVQNIDIMNLAGFCRNCLSKWYVKAAKDQGVEMQYDDAREIVYGMPYETFKAMHQKDATPEQLQAYNSKAPVHSDVCAGGTEQGKALEELEASQAGRLLPLGPQDPNRMAAAMAQSLAAGVTLRIGILTVSDRAAAGTYADRSGPAVVDTLKRVLGAEADRCMATVRSLVVPDEHEDIQRAIIDWAAEAEPINLILTTGGTGFAPRDVTPEATRGVCDREAPGLALAVLQAGAQKSPMALASRLFAGIRRRSVVLNLPGNPNAVAQCLEPVVPLLLRAVSLCDQA